MVLIGASGSGKTVIARETARRIGWTLYDTDAEILNRTGESRISDIFDSAGEPYFRELEQQCLAELRQPDANVVVATGGGLPAIPGLMDELNRLGVCIYLRASLETLWKRLNTDPRQLEDRPLLRDGGKEALERLLAKRAPIYTRAAVTLDTDQLSVEEVCALLVAGLPALGE